MERLTIRSKNSDMVWFKDAENGNAHLEPCEMTAHHNRMALDKLATYEDAEEQGQILRLPCKVGDTVYAFLSTCNYFTECQINKIELKPTLYGNTCYFLEPIGHRGCLYRCFEDEFGKTVFLTKEKAEAKLKEMGEKDGE